MSITAKNMATFMLGVAAGAAMLKYQSMTDEEKEELTKKLQDKANEVKTEAEATVATLQSYFEDLRTQGMDALKQFSGEAEKMVQDFMNQSKTNPNGSKPA
jgi:dsDNA-specific endonuclease/ATPase MutS2